MAGRAAGMWSREYNPSFVELILGLELFPKTHFKDQMSSFELPDGPIDIVADCACALLDIPITNRVHALHQLFTLYQERGQNPF